MFFKHTLVFQSEKEFDARDRNRSHSHDPFQQRLVDFRCIFASGKDTDAMCDQEHRQARRQNFRPKAHLPFSGQGSRSYNNLPIPECLKSEMLQS